MFQNSPTKSPVNQDFIWLAEYSNGTHLSEFDFLTQAENDFTAIKRQNLIRFGLIGLGYRMFFECFGGSFKISGRMFDFVYKTKGNNYHLTGRPQMYNDIITYKNAESFIDLGGRGGSVNRILQYNFGFKNKLEFEDVQFHVQILCEIPFDEPVRFHIKLVSNKTLNGQLVILQNGLLSDEFDAPLKKNVGGELNWLMR